MQSSAGVCVRMEQRAKLFMSTFNSLDARFSSDLYSTVIVGAVVSHCVF